MELAMRMSRKARYAVTAMLDLALQPDQIPITLAEISQRQDISVSYLEQIFSRLRREGLVEGMRGPGGGYCLSKPTGQISIADIVSAVDGPMVARETYVALVPSQKLWHALSRQVRDYLDTITLAQLMDSGRWTSPLPQRVKPAVDAERSVA
jgi:Rrf2 family transcriptional regulator, iron-sulfur cluster assembly transcription factor